MALVFLYKWIPLFYGGASQFKNVSYPNGVKEQSFLLGKKKRQQSSKLATLKKKGPPNHATRIT